MTHDVTPERPDGTAGPEEWTYGTEIERPLNAAPPTMPDTETGEDDEPAQSRHSDGQQGRAKNRTEGDGARAPAVPPREQTGDDAGSAEARRNVPDDPAQPGKQKQDRADTEHEKKDEPPPPPPSKWVFIIVGLLLLAVLAWGGYIYWTRYTAASATQKATVDEVPQLRVVAAQRNDKPVELTLPGQTEALNTANLYARATGYVTERRVDIGSRVKKGELMLHITAPDLDQQLAQAEAQVGQVKAAEAQATAQVSQADANVNLAKVTLARTATLTNQGYETLQNRDNQTANLLAQQATLATAQAGVKVAEANTKAQLATVDRLKALTGFEDVIAPFDGVVTTRNVDVGDLINADTASANPMFSVARDDVIRVTVQVPQNASVGVRDGLPAKIEVPQMPGEIFRGTVTRSSVALLSSARTLDTEVDIPNPDGKLRPGLFAYVSIEIPADHPTVSVPAEALIFNQNGLQVATTDGQTATIHSVKIYRDLGTTVELSEGLNGGEQVILSPPALLTAGEKVQIQKPEQKKPDQGSGAKAS